MYSPSEAARTLPLNIARLPVDAHCSPWCLDSRLSRCFSLPFGSILSFRLLDHRADSQLACAESQKGLVPPHESSARCAEGHPATERIAKRAADLMNSRSRAGVGFGSSAKHIISVFSSQGPLTL